MKPFKIRASAAGSIMAGNVGLSEPQQKKLITFQDKVKAGKELTLLQAAENDKLLKLLSNPQLPAGAKTYCEVWHKEQIYERRKEISGGPLEKGNFCEDESIRFLNIQLLDDHVKNEIYKEDEWMTGTADIISGDMVIDMKNSFTFDTFPLHDFGIKNKDYFYQLQVYMHLYGKQRAELRYALMNMPHHMIERAAKREAYYTNSEYDDVFTKVYNQLTYDKIDPKYRYKIFKIEFDPSIIEEVKKRVILCRKYITELDERIK